MNALIVTHGKQVHFIGFVLDGGDRREQYTTFDMRCVSPLFPAHPTWLPLTDMAIDTTTRTNQDHIDGMGCLHLQRLRK